MSGHNDVISTNMVSKPSQFPYLDSDYKDNVDEKIKIAKIDQLDYVVNQ